jgi:hypothetical protein
MPQSDVTPISHTGSVHVLVVASGMPPLGFQNSQKHYEEHYEETSAPE